ncbi:hypothetical protein [Sphaerospermopsis sp. LEGE 08334]|jgi:hypothetical protein|uniref:hypothetical protein n=1 Tax=Sphaerospermopsis sp. LEGE 08334 TaxID=1828651 RepID=UPI00187FECAB|nr:hypothetical protein [Sphaerospermopsis sp. LEGE 08334]MBE9059282.1 hypothetical protein [Sphaerospermopsis sp. LEGE 08334]
MVKLNFYGEQGRLVFSEEYSHAQGGIVDFYLNKKYDFGLSHKSGTIIEYNEYGMTSKILPGYENYITVKFDDGSINDFNLIYIYHEINDIPIP